MMKILITSATKDEIEPLIKRLPGVLVQNNLYISGNIRILISGIGVTSTAYEITRQIGKEIPDMIFNIGIAGSADPDIKIGDVVEVSSEYFADLGIVKDNFVRAENCGFIYEDIYQDGLLLNTGDYNLGLQKVLGRTVHTIDYRGDRSFADRDFQIESMEGAAFFYVCLKEQLPFSQIRAVSNIVGDGNKENWDIDTAISNLNETLIRILKL